MGKNTGSTENTESTEPPAESTEPPAESAVFVRITRHGYSHRGRSYSVGSVLKVSPATADAILTYETPAWGEKISAAEAKKAGVITDVSSMTPANVPIQERSVPALANAAAAAPAEK